MLFKKTILFYKIHKINKNRSVAVAVIREILQQKILFFLKLCYKIRLKIRKVIGIVIEV